MSTNDGSSPASYQMKFDPGTIKHLGLQMYSTLPPVISELVANAWDAGAQTVRIAVPTSRVDDASKIVVEDDGDGMADHEIEHSYLVVGRDRRRDEQSDRRNSPPFRRIMGRKGIGKFAGFGIARAVEIETVSSGAAARFVMDYDDMERATSTREVRFPKLPPTGEVGKGTRVTLSNIQKFRQKSIDLIGLRRGLARRFAVIGHDFSVFVNDDPITIEERDLQSLLERGHDGKPYIWTYGNVEIEPRTEWRVSGWIGTLPNTTRPEDGVQRGVAIMARGKLVQEPFIFEASVGQQYAYSYIVGELHAEFVDEEEDTISTTRNSLVWDTDANRALREWGAAQLAEITREWGRRRSADKEAKLERHPAYREFVKQTEGMESKRARKAADGLLRNIIRNNPVEDDEGVASTVQMFVQYLEFDSFLEIVEELSEVGVENPSQLLGLFRRWETIEAIEMAKVTNGRIKTIERLQDLLDSNALEVPDLHRFLKEFPWVIDPRWHLVADEIRYSELLRRYAPESEETPEVDRRIDFLCVREGETLIVVEIKRPQCVASLKELEQITDYVDFMRTRTLGRSNDEHRVRDVIGYLLCGRLAEGEKIRQVTKRMQNDGIYVRSYEDLLQAVQRMHAEFLERYETLRATRLAGDSRLIIDDVDDAPAI